MLQWGAVTKTRESFIDIKEEIIIRAQTLPISERVTFTSGRRAEQNKKVLISARFIKASDCTCCELTLRWPFRPQLPVSIRGNDCLAGCYLPSSSCNYTYFHLETHMPSSSDWYSMAPTKGL